MSCFIYTIQEHTGFDSVDLAQFHWIVGLNIVPASKRVDMCLTVLWIWPISMFILSLYPLRWDLPLKCISVHFYLQ